MPSTIHVSPATTAPKTHSQPSRKSKRAWRKNIDLDTVSAGLDNARQEQIITGGKGLLADQPASALFQTDTSGDTTVRERARKDHDKPLKADEIIAQRSAVPALQSRKRPGDNDKLTNGVLAPPSKRSKKGGVSHAEYQRLRQVAYGGDPGSKDLVERLEEATVTYDPWAADDAGGELVASDPQFSFVDPPKPVRAPATIKRAPVSLRADGRMQANVSKPNAGRSYNPAFDDWSALIASEGDKELEAERKRLRAAEEEAERMERVARAAEEAEKENEDKEFMSEYESEWEGIQSDVDEAQLSKKRPQRKTPAERNKVKRRKEAERQAKHEARMKARDEQAKKIKAIKAEVDAKEAARNQALAKLEAADVVDADDEDADGKGAKLRRRAFRKEAVPEAPLELVLPDELQDSLRLLKPEGNLLKDRFRNVMVQGKVEARKPITQPKKAWKKSTEKWSYKDWRL